MENNERLHVGDIVKHFKGGVYQIIAVAKYTETEIKEPLVIYQSLKTGETFARPYNMFMEKIDKKEYPEATQEYRLEFIASSKFINKIGEDK